MGMNPNTGDIERLTPPQQPPKEWLSLTEEEAAEYETLPKQMRVERYIRDHREDKCVTCGGFVGNHSVNRFIKCTSSEIARRRLEDQMSPAFK